MLKVVRIELKKSAKKFSKKFLFIILLLSIFAGFLTHHSIHSGLKSDDGFYTVGSPFKIPDEGFVYYHTEDAGSVEDGKVDVFLGKSSNLYLVLTETDRSRSAADELSNYLKNEFESELYKRYGKDAFPVYVDAVYLKRDLVYQPQLEGEDQDPTTQGKTQEQGAGNNPEEIKEDKDQNEVSPSFEGDGHAITTTSSSSEYKTPRNFSPPSLMGKMIFAFFFIIPSYFVIQVFSSSLIEDRVTRKIDVLLSTPISGLQLLLGKMIPYVAISAFMVLMVALLFDKSPMALIYIIPIILFFAALQMFLALISRSYREMTFLVISSSLVVTAYIFIPAIFGGSIPVSKVSPITLMLAMFEGESIGISDYIFATFQFYAMGAVLLYFSSKALSPEVMSSHNLSQRFLILLQGAIKREYHTLAAAMASIPFIFMAEFLLLSILFVMPLEKSIPIFLLIIATVEEIFKGGVVYAAHKNGLNAYTAALFCGVGFFAGEKVITLLNVVTQFNNLFFAQYLIIPLIIHVTSIMVFAFIMKKWSFKYAIACSSLLHFTYNYGVLMLI
ncbi:MAG: ABC transporter permease [Halobacteriota archaeon]